ncbi:ABC transporter permease [Limisphaera sp. 4302-co]|uniref:ABC transporter permease n=1 Tax=Limisphaera sp. 4302-co TaxID=3400417 RepID=UPI003C23F574
MRAILTLGHNDLRLFLRSRMATVWLFLMPLAFVYFMGFANRGADDPADPRSPVLVENHDGGFLSRLFLDELGAQGMAVLDPSQRARARRGIRIPADFTERVCRGETARVEFFRVSDALTGGDALIEFRLLRTVMAMNGHLLELVTRHGWAAVTNESAWRSVLSLEDPVRLESRFAGRRPVPAGFHFSLPGVLVMYLLMNLTVFGGAALGAERRNGVLRRLAATALPRGAMIAGKLYGLGLLGGVQIVFLLATGRFLFGVPLGANLPAVLVTLLLFAWVAAAMGVLAGSAIRSEDRVVGICVLASLLMAALGGCWWPLEVAPGALKTVAHFLPTGWAMDALHQLISFGAGWTAVIRPLTVLTGFGALFTTLAVRAFRV